MLADYVDPILHSLGPIKSLWYMYFNCKKNYTVKITYLYFLDREHFPTGGKSS